LVSATSAVDVPSGRPLAPFAFGTFSVLAAMVGLLYLDQPFAALAVPPAVAVGWLLLFRLPLKVSVVSLLALAALCEGLEAPLRYGWEAPLYPLARALLLNASAVTGVGFLRAPVLDLLTVALWVLSLLRSRDRRWLSQTPSVRALDLALAVSAGTVLSLDVLGALRGGNVGESLWQLRHLLLFPVRTALLIRALDGSARELKTVGLLLIAVGVVKALIGIWFLYGFVYPTGREVEFTTSHTDTLVFVPLLAMFFAQLVERFHPKLVWRGVLWVPIVFWGLVCNDRRLAYVCLLCACAATLALSPRTRFKKAMLKGLVCVSPFVPPYLAAGWNSSGGHFFWLAQLARSLVDGDPNQGNQADYRDLENLNVLFTWNNNRLLPYGFGHKMQTLFPLPDISTWFPTWEYHPHNQYLWLLAIGGPVGFTLLMLPQVLTIFLCARAYRASRELTERVAMLTGIAIIISFFCQVWGDMGTLSWTVTWMPALAGAFAAKLAARTGAVVPQLPAKSSAEASRGARFAESLDGGAFRF
jgi:hypothetical protein